MVGGPWSAVVERCGLVGFKTGAELGHVGGVSREDERAEHLGDGREVRVDDIGRLAGCEQRAD